MTTNNDNERLMNIENEISINDDLKDYINNYIDENEYIKTFENEDKSNSLNKYDDFKQLMFMQNMNNDMNINE